jgi:ribosomal-protein-alanine N-acetyltransferase
VGELLLISGIKLAVIRGCSELTLEVRKTNYVAQSLYAKYGLVQRGVRKGYYTDNHEDAYIMTTPSIQAPAFQNEFERLQEEHALKWGVSTLQLD